MAKTNKPLTAEGNKCFFCCNGEVYSTPEELCSGLKNMDDNSFSYHSNADKCDFAEWIRHVFKKKRVANKMHKRRENNAELCKCVQELVK